MRGWSARTWIPGSKKVDNTAEGARVVRYLLLMCYWSYSLHRSAMNIDKIMTLREEVGADKLAVQMM
jgi:hypothetical protein